MQVSFVVILVNKELSWNVQGGPLQTLYMELYNI